MSARVLSLLALLCAVGLAAPAAGGAAVSKSVKRVLNDYKNDGKIDPCKHTAKGLRATLKAIEANTEQYAPDFPAAVEAALEARAGGECKRRAEATPTPTPEATSTPAPSAPSTPSAPSAPAAPVAPSAPVTPAVPETPVVPETTPAPAPPQEVVPDPPAPDGAGIAAGTPTPAPTDRNLVLERAAAREAANGSQLGPAPWIVLGSLLGAGLLALLMMLFMRRYGWGEERLAPLTHAVGEAGYRTGGTWQAFTDWVRRGR